MPRERDDIDDLKLRATASNIRKALRNRASKSGVPKREELEQMFADLKQSYELAADDVRIRGAVIEVTRYTGKGTAYTIDNVNPYFRVMTKLSAQLAMIARVLGKLDAPKSKDVEPGSFEDLFPDIAKEHVS
jgi:hypothetical protein